MSKAPYLPVYRRIEQTMRERIAAGDWPAGGMIPARRALAYEFQVGLPTVEQAISLLLVDGTLETMGRRGTFVATNAGQSPAKDFTATEAELPHSWLETIGIIATINPAESMLPGTGNEFTRSLVGAIERSFSHGDRSSIFYNLYEGVGAYTPISQALDDLLARGVDAFIVVANYDDISAANAKANIMASRDVLAVFLAPEELQRDMPQVISDNRYAGFHAAEHLLNRGYGPLYFVAPFLSAWGESRIQGASNAIRTFGTAAAEIKVIPSHATVEPWEISVPERDQWFTRLGYEAAPEVFHAIHSKPGIIAVNDLVAYGVLQSASERSLTAGSDFGIVGFDDLYESKEVGLTSSHPQPEMLAREAVRLLEQHAEGQTGSVQVRLRPLLSPALQHATSTPQAGLTERQFTREKGP